MQTRMHWELERQKKKACPTLTTTEKLKNGGHLEIRAAILKYEPKINDKMVLWDW